MILMGPFQPELFWDSINFIEVSLCKIFLLYEAFFVAEAGLAQV